MVIGKANGDISHYKREQEEEARLRSEMKTEQQ